MATTKQVNYALMLLGRAGFPTRYMKSDHKELGATMRQRSGTVEGWLRGMNSAEASALIDRLKTMQPYRASEDAEVKQLQSDAGPDADVAELRRIADLR